MSGIARSERVPIPTASGDRSSKIRRRGSTSSTARDSSFTDRSTEAEERDDAKVLVVT